MVHVHVDISVINKFKYTKFVNKFEIYKSVKNMFDIAEEYSRQLCLHKHLLTILYQSHFP